MSADGNIRERSIQISCYTGFSASRFPAGGFRLWDKCRNSQYAGATQGNAIHR
ncbi:hypothetical protein CLOSTASPAR_02025 [[Clostridium] asparagiforme DSM 15981]|uniref:Uncharacterized protein n=1 Tax=[Clostridium] asparagiforme DSM 15981 TaxID=518636 RepID=C0CYE9_9FIRM|nr:hypothetical protein CLOSTASPAR_02025 [[Clostridium] asparagiforme DSM 15981]